MIKNLLSAAMLATAFTSYAQTTVFSEGFDTVEDIQKWQYQDLDGDGEIWEFYNAEEEDMPAYSTYFATSWSWFLDAFTPDNSLISPAITLPSTSDKLTLKFKIGAGDDGVFDEHYAVYVLPVNEVFDGSQTAVFEETLDAGYTETLKNIEVDITEFKGQEVKLVFRHYDCTDILFIGLDDIEVLDETELATSSASKVSFAVYPNPVQDVLKIKGLSAVSKVKVFDLVGKKHIEVEDSKVEVRQLKAGVYLINIYSGDKVYTKKFIKN